MQPWLIALACIAGAGFIAYFGARLRLRWPLAALSLLLAAIASQLFLAARGEAGFHDLAAIRAQMFTVAPALAGLLAGLALAIAQGHPRPGRDLPGLILITGTLIAAAALAASLMI